MSLTHRERVLRAVNHEAPDRMPRDLGGTYASSISLMAHQRLMQHLGISGESAVIRKWASVVRPDEALLKHFDIDTRMIVPRYEADWNEYWKLTPMPEEGEFQDEWGVVWRKPETGHSFISKHPLSGEPDIDAIERYPWPDPDDPKRYDGLRDQAKELKENTDYAVIGMFPRPIVSLSQFLRGYEDWFVDMAMNLEFMEALMDKVLEIDLKIGKHLFDEIGKYVDLVFVHDDLATQENLMFSPDTYRKIVKPRHQKIFNFIKTHSDAKVIYHTDGAIYPILEDFVEIGVDALNPVQTSAKGMDSETLSRDFGGRLCFWGGIDTQHTLPKGSPEDVRREVESQIRTLGKNGNYVLSAVHNIQDDVPPENIVAMFEAAQEYGKY